MLPHFRNKKGRAEAWQISLPLAATQLPRAKACRSLNLSFGQALDTRQKLAGRLANPASQHAKIAAVIAQKLQNIVSDGLRALAQKQLLQKGKNFALMRQRAAIIWIKIIIQAKIEARLLLSSLPRKTAGLWRRFCSFIANLFIRRAIPSQSPQVTSPGYGFYRIARQNAPL